MNEITQILRAAESGETAENVAEKLLPLLYEELRRLATHQMARQRPGQTLQATALVHEAYLRLVGQDERGRQHWDGRGHFFAAAAEAMRRILIDRARQKQSLKRGGDHAKLNTARLRNNRRLELGKFEERSGSWFSRD